MIDPETTKFDITSCQFSIHYGFESESQAKVIVKNACEKIKVGGYFVGTTLNSKELIRRLKRAQKSDQNVKTFGSEVYNIEFDSCDSFPEFGCKYHFQLDGVVNCPEFLCDIRSLSQLVAEFGFELDESFSFRKAFEKFKDDGNCKRLLSILNAFEPYYPGSNTLSSKSLEDYDHAKHYFAECLRRKRETHSRDRFSIGTISQSEWEAISVYHCFVFRRVSESRIKNEFEYDEKQVLLEVEESLDDESELQPPLVHDYYPKKLNYSNRK